MADAQPMTLRVPDPDRRWSAVRLCSDLHLDSREFERSDGEWVLELPPLRLHRVEYELEVEHADGGTEWIADPGHGVRAPGAFGEKSVVEAAGYVPPWWLDAPAAEESRTRLQLGTAMRRRVTAELWAPADADPGEPLPLLVAHDGPEYDRLARLTRWAGAMVADGRVPPFRLLLMPPGDRDNWYSASEGYARAFVERLAPVMAERIPQRSALVGMGASLGALALLHIQRRFPGMFGGLFLQSGSFFTPETDPMEIGFSRFGRITPFVRGVHRTREFAHPIPVAITCGAEEENADNNRLMVAALSQQGYPVDFTENPDMHNYTGWRDALDPPLTGLLAMLWS